MMMRSTALLLLLLALPTTAYAQRMLTNPPPGFVAADRDLVVVATVTKASDPFLLTITVPGDNDPPAKRYFRRYTLKVSQIIKGDLNDVVDLGSHRSAGVRRPAMRSLTALGLSGPPPGPGPMPIGAMRVNLSEGKSYALMLCKLPGQEDYYLPAHPINHVEADDEKIAALERALRVDSWPWGEPQDGLQVALLLSRQNLRLHKSYVREPGETKAELRFSCRIEFVIALRNTSDAPLRVNLYPGDKCLSVTATGPEGKTLSAEVYREFQDREVGEFNSSFVHEIPAGKVLFVDAEGKAKMAMIRSLTFDPGEWEMKASYSSPRLPKSGTMWQGAIESAPVKVEVEPFGTRPRRPSDASAPKSPRAQPGRPTRPRGLAP